MTVYDYIIYHRGCPDGFASVAVAHLAKAIDSNTILLPDDPFVTSAPTILQNKTVLIVDVAYKLNVIEEICRAAKRVLMIDHHITTQDQLQGKALPSNFQLIFKDGVCGALITWQHFFGHSGSKPPKALTYINDNDVGIWKHESTVPFMLALDVTMSTKPKWSNVLEWADLISNDKAVKPLIKRGGIYQEYQRMVSTRSAFGSSVMAFPSKELFDMFPGAFEQPAQYTVALLNGGCPSVTAAAAAVMENIPCDFVMIWVYNLPEDTYRFSMRSKEVDVAAIASALNPHGGGHKLAASFSISGAKIAIKDMFTIKPHRNALVRRGIPSK